MASRFDSAPLLDRGFVSGKPWSVVKAVPMPTFPTSKNVKINLGSASQGVNTANASYFVQHGPVRADVSVPLNGNFMNSAVTASITKSQAFGPVKATAAISARAGVSVSTVDEKNQYNINTVVNGNMKVEAGVVSFTMTPQSAKFVNSVGTDVPAKVNMTSIATLGPKDLGRLPSFRQTRISKIAFGVDMSAMTEKKTATPNSDMPTPGASEETLMTSDVETQRKHFIPSLTAKVDAVGASVGLSNGTSIHVVANPGPTMGSISRLTGSLNASATLFDKKWEMSTRVLMDKQDVLTTVGLGTSVGKWNVKGKVDTKFNAEAVASLRFDAGELSVGVKQSLDKLTTASPQCGVAISLN